MIDIPVSYGELVDKLTILEIKLANITDNSKHKNVRVEYNLLLSKYQSIANKTLDQYNQLKDINQKLWIIEDEIRECERKQDFSDTFVQLARSVYINNDERSRIKRKINETLSSSIIEEKSYTKYTQ